MMERIIAIYEKIFMRGIFVVGIPLIIITVIESINAIGRKLFMPLPCALESVESLMVISTYFGVSFVAKEGGHVNITMMTQRLPLSVQTFLDAVANLLGAFIFGIWTWGAWLRAFKALMIMEIRIGVFRFPIWPFKILFAIGLTMLTIQLIINTIKFVMMALSHPIAEIKQEEKTLLEM